MKAVRILLKVVLWIFCVALALVLTLPFWISPVGRLAANVAVPKITGCAFHLDRLDLSVDWLSLATDTIVVKDISVGGLYYEQDLKLPETLFDGNTREKIERLARGEGGSAKAGARPEPAKPKPEPARPAEKKRSKKVIIDHLLLEDVVVAMGPVKIPVPRIELSGIGRNTAGVTVQEAWTEISAQIVSGAKGLNKHAGKALDLIRDLQGLFK